MKLISRHLRGTVALLAALLFLTVSPIRADEKLPPAPAQYFNDFANVTQPATRQQLNDKLRQFEADTSSQVVVAIYSTLPDGAEINQYSTRLFQSWHIGQKGKDNGIGLFVFTQSRQMFIVTGYGMEGPLPDATCKTIIENDIKPHFKTGDYDGGLNAGVDAILAATRGEYHGNGHTDGESTNPSDGSTNGTTVHGFPLSLILGAIVLLLVLFAFWRATHHTTYSDTGGQSTSWPGFLLQLLFNVLSNVTISSGGGGGGGFSGGGFSGGGGSTGGGGAGGSW